MATKSMLHIQIAFSRSRRMRHLALFLKNVNLTPIIGFFSFPLGFFNYEEYKTVKFEKNRCRITIFVLARYHRHINIFGIARKCRMHI